MVPRPARNLVHQHICDYRITSATAVGAADVSVIIEVSHSFQGEAGETVLVRQNGGNPDALRGLYDEAF